MNILRIRSWVSTYLFCRCQLFCWRVNKKYTTPKEKPLKSSKIFSFVAELKCICQSAESDNIFHILDKQTFVPTLPSNFLHKTVRGAANNPRDRNLGILFCTEILFFPLSTTVIFCQISSTVSPYWGERRRGGDAIEFHVEIIYQMA